LSLSSRLHPPLRLSLSPTYPPHHFSISTRLSPTSPSH
jgi:hypothetical protein